MRDKWVEEILKRFGGREDLGKRGLYEKYFKSQNLDEKEVLECFEEIESNYNIPVGVLRPDDSLTKLTERVSTNNPFKWFWWLGRNEFSDDSLIEELGIRMKEQGVFDDWKIINTFEDYVRAWCGQKPNS
jgi:hypothetical protein